MDTDILLTDQEEGLLDSLVAQLYQSGADINGAINQIDGLGGKKTDLFSSAIYSVSFHQREREDYVIASIFGKKITSSNSRKVIMLALANNPTSPDEALRALNIPELPATAIGTVQDQEVLNQLAIYKTVEENLYKLQTQLITRYNVMPVFPLLKNIPAEKLQEISAGIENYINYCLGLEEKVLFSDLPLPPALEKLLMEVSPSLPAFKAESTLERINYMKELLVICSVLVENSARLGQSPDWEIAEIAGKVLALTNTPISYR